MKKIAWIPLGAADVASSRLRVYQIADALHHHYGVTSYYPGTPMNAPPDVLVAQVYGPEVIQLANQLRASGCRTFLDICDNVWDPHSPNYNRNWDITQALKTFDAVIAATPILAAQLQERYPSVTCHMLPDCLDMREFTGEVKTHQPIERFLRIGWFGTELNMKFLHLILPVLKSLNDEVPVVLRVITNTMNGLIYALPGIPVEFIPWSLETYYDDLLQCDIAVMPMEVNDWTRVKGANRLQLCLALGIPAVVSPAPAYVELMEKHPEVSFIAGNDAEWHSSLTGLLDPQLRNTVAKRGREIVATEHSLDHYFSAWYSALFAE